MKEKRKGDRMAPACTYNLVILDESGSMRTVRGDTISGCNKLLKEIGNTAMRMRDVRQYVSVFCFDTSHSRYIFHDTPVEDIRELTPADYHPNAYTPLYDAIGYTVTQLSDLLDDTDAVGMVTIITDGHENASHRWDHLAVAELIERMKGKGWVFSFISSIEDVEETATKMGIDNFLKFEKTREGMARMFEAKRQGDIGYNSKRTYVERMRRSESMEDEEREMVYAYMNCNFFIPENRTAPDVMEHLDEDEIFVFESNIHGMHHGNTSLHALTHFGAVNGQAEGVQGQCYAIPSVGNSLEGLGAAIERFNEYAATHPQKKFFLSGFGNEKDGCALEVIAPLFRQAYAFGNVYVPRQFLPYMDISPMSRTGGDYLSET